METSKKRAIGLLDIACIDLHVRLDIYGSSNCLADGGDHLLQLDSWYIGVATKLGCLRDMDEAGPDRQLVTLNMIQHTVHNVVAHKCARAKRYRTGDVFSANGLRHEIDG